MSSNSRYVLVCSSSSSSSSIVVINSHATDHDAFHRYDEENQGPSLQSQEEITILEEPETYSPEQR